MSEQIKVMTGFHELKITAEHMNEIRYIGKRCEVRKNDRDYEAGDILKLNEYNADLHTGLFILAEITHVETYAQVDHVVLSIRILQ